MNALLTQGFNLLDIVLKFAIVFAKLQNKDKKTPLIINPNLKKFGMEIVKTFFLQKNCNFENLPFEAKITLKSFFIC